MFGSILKMLFSYKFFKVSRLFSQHPNKFHYKKFQNHNHNHKFFKVSRQFSRLFSQCHYHTTTITTKSKSQREIGGSKIGGSKARSIGGEIERRDAAVGMVRGAIGMVQSTRSDACDRRTRAQGLPATSKA